MNRQVRHINNRLRQIRQQAGLSRNELAQKVGVTRQAIYAVEMNQYLPSTDIALRVAQVLNCQVEDLFSLESTSNLIQGELVGNLPRGTSPIRAQVARVGNRMVVRPVSNLGEILNYTIPADGLIVGSIPQSSHPWVRHRVPVQLLKSRRMIEETIIVGGCDPAIFLAGGHFRSSKGVPSVVGWSMGSVQAIESLKRGDVHIAGLHIVDPATRDSNVPFLKKNLKKGDYTVVRFAAWEQGLMVCPGNPKAIREISSLTKRGVRVVNREEGAAARLLLDHRLKIAGISPHHVRGYDYLEQSHLHIGRAILEGRADVGIGVRSAALVFDLDFIPLQEEQYDLVIPTSFLTSHPALPAFLETLVSRSFQTEIEALGGYDIRDMGKIIDWAGSSPRRG